MGISTYNIRALRVFTPVSILDRTLEFFEFFRYETKSIRNNPVLLKEEYNFKKHKNKTSV
jgi:hypothetical protein